MARGFGLWFSWYVSAHPGGLLDLSTHWQTLQKGLKRRLPPPALLVSRENAIESFKIWVSGMPTILTVHGQSPQEVIDVFTAWVCSLSELEQAPIASRAIIVEKPDAWRELIDSGHRLILICRQPLEFRWQL